MSYCQKTFRYGNRTVSISTGELAQQATGAVLVDMEGTTVLVTVVAVKDTDPGMDFFPLTVDYIERTYAAGQIPGGFLKREGRPSERETLIARLIDRPIRPLFPAGFTNEVQIVAMVVSLNPEVEPDVPAMIGASAALAISGIPFQGPIACARVGVLNGQFVLNPSVSELAQSGLNLVVAGTETAVLMVESEAKFLPEDVMLEAVWFGHQEMQAAIKAIKELADEAGKPKWEWKTPVVDKNLEEALKKLVVEDLGRAYQIAKKADRNTELERLKNLAIEKLVVKPSAENPKPSIDEKVIRRLFENLERQIVRQRILDGHPRIDGRDTRTVRPLNIKAGVLARTHGSALFTRGETQALVVATLGTEKSSQILDSIMGDTKDRFLFHYNFPPYCTGEVGSVGSPRRREIGHGRLAKRAILAVLPSKEDFPYVIRVVSEIMSSNGSSSMASVCGSSIALMDAGVPIKAPVAGIAMGLIKEENKFAILTDILGDEDHLGDMDFKVAGTLDGVTALQMDIKIGGISKFIMERALSQAKEARLHILQAMNAVIGKPREKLSTFAPTITTMKIDPEKIRDIIGKGGCVIRAITEETGATIDVTDDGVVSISAVDGEAGKAAIARITEIVGNLEVGKIYTGTVVKIMDFGAFVSITPNKDGFLHISQIADERINRVEDRLKEGQVVQARLIEVDRQGRARLSMKPSVMAGGDVPQAVET